MISLELGLRERRKQNPSSRAVDVIHSILSVPQCPYHKNIYEEQTQQLANQENGSNSHDTPSLYLKSNNALDHIPHST